MPRLQSLLFALVVVSSTVLAAVNDPCTVNGTPGICIASTSCSSSGGTSSSQPDCPNDPEDIKCCTKGCGTGGTCMFSSSCTGGTSTANLCPGPANFQCCTPSAGGGGGAPPPPSGGGATDLSAHGVAFIAGFEGFRGDFYNDAAGVKTIGYGHACQPSSACDSISAPITEAQGQALLAQDAASFTACVHTDVTVPLTQNQFDALVSFSFNLGCGSLADLLPDLNSNNFAGATAQMKSYVHAGGATLPGLVTRRNAEVALFNTA